MKAAIQMGGEVSSSEFGTGALLSPADSRQRARALRAWRKEQLEWVQSFVSRLAIDWHRAWGVSSVPVLHEASDAPLHFQPGDSGGVTRDDGMASGQAQSACAWRYGAPGDASAGWQTSLHRGPITDEQSRAPLAAIHASMFGEEASQPATVPSGQSIAMDLTAAAWADWWRRLELDFPAPEHPAPAASVPHPWWSGSLQCHLPWCGGAFVIELNAEQLISVMATHAPDLLIVTTPAAAAPTTKTVGLLSALGGQTVPLRAMLSGVELTLRQIQSLRVGDIVPLQHRLDEPTLVETPDAFVVCHGWLGKKSGQVALEMVSRFAPSHKV